MSSSSNNGSDREDDAASHGMTSQQAVRKMIAGMAVSRGHYEGSEGYTAKGADAHNRPLASKEIAVLGAIA